MIYSSWKICKKIFVCNQYLCLAFLLRQIGIDEKEMSEQIENMYVSEKNQLRLLITSREQGKTGEAMAVMTLLTP